MLDNQQLLEPVTTFAKLVMLNFASLDAKISIKNHVVTIDDPAKKLCYLHHLFERKTRGDSKENISILNSPIQCYIQWFICNTHLNHDPYIELAKYAVCGLKKLSNTYKNIYGESLVTLTLKYYINLINSCIVDQSNFEIYASKDESFNDLINDDKLKQIWEYNNVVELVGEFAKCFDPNCVPKTDDFTNGRIKGLNDLLEKKDLLFCGIIQKVVGGK